MLALGLVLVGLELGGVRDPVALGDQVGRYLTSASFAADVAENWQSEYLQFLLYVVGTVWLVQRGSPESKPADKVGRESDETNSLGRM